MRHELEQQKNCAYRERNIVLAGLAKLLHDLPGNPYNVYVARDGSAENGWSTLLVIDDPKEGQMSWHFHESEEVLLDGISHRESEYVYDCHETWKKYIRFCTACGVNYDTSVLEILND